MWGTEVPVAQERSFAPPWMASKAEVRQQQARATPAQKAAKAREWKVERWLPEKALAPRPKERRKRRLGPKLAWLRLENLWPQEPAQGRKTAEREPPEHLPLASARAPKLKRQQKVMEPLAMTKNSSHQPRSLRAWAELGREVRLERQASQTGGTLLWAWKLLARLK